MRQVGTTSSLEAVLVLQTDRTHCHSVQNRCPTRTLFGSLRAPKMKTLTLLRIVRDCNSAVYIQITEQKITDLESVVKLHVRRTNTMEQAPLGLFVGNPFVDASANVSEDFLKEHKLEVGSECPSLTTPEKQEIFGKVRLNGLSNL